jgi:hypothetical protein
MHAYHNFGLRDGGCVVVAPQHIGGDYSTWASIERMDNAPPPPPQPQYFTPAPQGTSSFNVGDSASYHPGGAPGQDDWIRQEDDDDWGNHRSSLGWLAPAVSLSASLVAGVPSSIFASASGTELSESGDSTPNVPAPDDEHHYQVIEAATADAAEGLQALAAGPPPKRPNVEPTP